MSVDDMSDESIEFLLQHHFGLWCRRGPGEPSFEFRRRADEALRRLALRHGADDNPVSIRGYLITIANERR